MDYENLRYEVSEAIATITIDRPKVLNALNRATIQELKDVLEKAGGNPSVRVIILTGAGDKAFIGGADVREMYERIKTSGAGGPVADFRKTLIDPLLSLGKPIIAAVNGYCLGGGLEIVYACTLAYAATKARFGQPEVNLGFNPLAGATQQLPLLAGKCVRQAGYLTLEQGLELEAKCYALCCAGQEVPRRLGAFLGKSQAGS